MATKSWVYLCKPAGLARVVAGRMGWAAFLAKSLPAGETEHFLLTSAPEILIEKGRQVVGSFHRSLSSKKDCVKKNLGSHRSTKNRGERSGEERGEEVLTGLRRENATDGNFLSARRIRAESEWNNRKAEREEARTELRN